MKKLLLILTLNISLLFSPPPKAGTTDPNGRYVSLSPFAGFFLNPDTYGFIFPAIEPGQLLTSQSQRQSRPLFILAGSAVGYAITGLTWPFHNRLLRLYGAFWRGTYPADRILLIGNFYLGFLLLNVLVLWLSLFLFERIFFSGIRRSRDAEYSLYFLMVFIVSNPVTKAFFWTVHQQMFSFLTPIFCIYVLLWFNRRPDALSGRQMIMLFLGGGALLLVYGNFLLLLPVMLFGFFQQFRKLPGQGSRLLLKASGLFLVFFLPTILWIGILKWTGVSYYSFELQGYHEIIWIPETLHHSVGSFLKQLGQNTLEFLGTLRQFGILMLFSVIIFASAGFKISWNDPLLPGTLFVFGCFFCFQWLLGFYEERLTNTLIPVMVCIWALLLGQKIAEKKVIYVVGGLALTWQFCLLFSSGPYY